MDKLEYKLEVFEGPLDLLLHLISKNKLNISDIELSVIVDQYIEHIRNMQQSDMDIASEFLEMASRLIYLKTVSLLPKHDEAEKMKEELVEELMEYERCRKIANRFFHPDEIDALDANTVSAFYNIWTAKEAYVKFTGQGIDRDFSEFCIFDLDEYLFQTEFERCSLSVCTPDFCEVEIIDLYNRREK